MAYLGSTNSAGGRGTYKPLKAHPEKAKEILSYPSVMSHFIDSEPSCNGEATCEHVCQVAMTEEYQYILKNDV